MTVLCWWTGSGRWWSRAGRRRLVWAECLKKVENGWKWSTRKKQKLFSSTKEDLLWTEKREGWWSKTCLGMKGADLLWMRNWERIWWWRRNCLKQTRGTPINWTREHHWTEKISRESQKEFLPGFSPNIFNTTQLFPTARKSPKLLLTPATSAKLLCVAASQTILLPNSVPFSLNLDLPWFFQDLPRSSAARLALWWESSGPDCAAAAAVTGSPTLVQSYPPYELSEPNIPVSTALTNHSTFYASSVKGIFPSIVPFGQYWREFQYQKSDSSVHSVEENHMLSIPNIENPFLSVSWMTRAASRLDKEVLDTSAHMVARVM